MVLGHSELAGISYSRKCQKLGGPPCVRKGLCLFPIFCHVSLPQSSYLIIRQRYPLNNIVCCAISYTRKELPFSQLQAICIIVTITFDKSWGLNSKAKGYFKSSTYCYPGSTLFLTRHAPFAVAIVLFSCFAGLRFVGGALFELFSVCPRRHRSRLCLR